MIRHARPPLTLSGSAALLLLLLVGVTGCANSNPQVLGLPNRHVVELNSDDVVRVMKRAGFSDQQILDHGTDLRNQLATSGAAQIRIDKKVEAMFAADGDCLHVSSRLRGSFIYDVKTGAIR